MLGYAEQVEQLNEAPHTRTDIGRPSASVMERYCLDREKAFSILVRCSSHRNTKLRLLAQQIIDVTFEATSHLESGSPDSFQDRWTAAPQGREHEWFACITRMAMNPRQGSRWPNQKMAGRLVGRRGMSWHGVRLNSRRGEYPGMCRVNRLRDYCCHTLGGGVSTSQFGHEVSDSSNRKGE